MAACTDGIDDGEEFSSDMTKGYAVMFIELMSVAVVNFGEARLMETGHAGGLIQSGAQSGAAAFTHFDFAAPLAAFTHPGVHAGIGQ